MNKLSRFIERISLPFALICFGFAIWSATETDINWYKVAFYFIIGLDNLRSHLEYLDSRVDS